MSTVEAMNGVFQQAKRAARGFRTSENFITIAYLLQFLAYVAHFRCQSS
ncbi:hypothetical protein D5041_09290 [Verminephrobacter aporrectodeae subsp. tuberculatae]|nr:hypothetical protein [Verminephrobacter aporrectodeae subsp. tuberculatae]MCW5289248.1 hypothetical protein [Verminephrobacter aporrectodeae subsp. tuberculatae]